MTRIPFLHPSFPDAASVAEDYSAIVGRGIFSNDGPVAREFEQQLARAIGGGVEVAAVSSGTSGLALAVSAAFHRDRPRVLVPSFTFAAGPLVLRSLGYEPVFFDIDGASWQPSLAEGRRFLQARGSETAGILLTSTFGVVDAAVHGWEALAVEHGLPLVIDSAAGFGSRYPSGEVAGARGTCEVFSFHATKVLAIGEGGAVSSTDPSLVEEIRSRKNFGFDAERQSVFPGTNAKLAELPAAIGLRQLRALPGRIAGRQAIFERYREALAPLGFEFQPLAGMAAIPFVSTLVPEHAGRDALMASLQHEQVECRCYYNPLVHRHPVFAGAPCFGPLEESERVAGRILSLPLADDLPDEAIRRIAAILERALGVASPLR